MEDFQARLKKKSGEIIWFSTNARQLRDETGGFAGVEGTVRDITHRKKMEQEMEMMRSYLKNIIDSMPSILISIDVDGNIIEWNQAAAGITGVSSVEAMGRKFWEVAPLFTPYKDDYREVLEARKPRHVHRQPYKADETKYYDVTLFPLIVNGVNGLVVRLDDMTETEEKDRQLRQAQKMDTIGTLSGGLAHDFNNILGGIMGICSLLRYRLYKKEPFSEPELDSFLSIMEDSSLRAADIVQQLLAISRNQELNLVPVDLNTTIRHIMKVCSISLDKKVELVPVYPAGPAYVLAETTQLQQVLLNLCVNAAHAMTLMKTEGQPQGGRLTVSVELLKADTHFCSTHPEAKPVEYWVLCVVDTGVGMDSKTVAKVFDPIFTTKEKGKGTGLGLAMVYNIVQQHKGFIDVYSEVGVGSTFSVYLPAVRCDDVVTARPGNREISRGAGLILVIDDEETLRNLARAILVQCGYTVILAENGIEGIERYKEYFPNMKAVLLDLVMPKIDGKETSREILSFDPKARVLMTSGFRGTSASMPHSRRAFRASSRNLTPWTNWPGPSRLSSRSPERVPTPEALISRPAGPPGPCGPAGPTGRSGMSCPGRRTGRSRDTPGPRPGNPVP